MAKRGRQLILSFLIIKFSATLGRIAICLKRFKQALKDPDPIVRQIACLLLSNLGYSCFSPAIFKLVDDPDKVVSREATLALLRLRNPQFLKDLYVRLHGEAPPSRETQAFIKILNQQLDEFFFHVIGLALADANFPSARFLEIGRDLEPIGHFGLLGKVLKLKDPALQRCILAYMGEAQNASAMDFLNALILPKEPRGEGFCEIGARDLLEYALFNPLPIKFIRVFNIIALPKAELTSAISQLQRYIGLKLFEMHSFGELKQAFWMIDNLLILIGFAFRCQDWVEQTLNEYRINFGQLIEVSRKISDREMRERFEIIIAAMEALAKNKILPSHHFNRLVV